MPHKRDIVIPALDFEFAQWLLLFNMFQSSKFEIFNFVKFTTRNINVNISFFLSFPQFLLLKIIDIEIRESSDFNLTIIMPVSTNVD